MDRLWAGWRAHYLDALTRPEGGAEAPSVNGDLAADANAHDAAGITLFERILHSGRPDEDTLIVWRGARCFALLNLYPYVSGHLLVLPNAPVVHLEELDAATTAELWGAVTSAVVAIKAAYGPDGINVGANLGAAAGAGVPEHLHVHVLPRWHGDTNFTTTLADTRIMPEPLSVTWRKLVDAWPAPT